jgi:hypothetical protein
MSTAKVDLIVDQGSDWSEGINFNNDDGTPVDLTGYSFLGTLKTSFYSNTVIANINVTIINAPVGNAAISMNSATSSNLSAGNYVYNINMIDNYGFVTKILGGLFTLRPSTLINPPPNGGAPSNAIG